MDLSRGPGSLSMLFNAAPCTQTLKNGHLDNPHVLSDLKRKSHKLSIFGHSGHSGHADLHFALQALLSRMAVFVDTIALPRVPY